LGSLLGGFKAGIVAGAWLAGSVSVFNALVLLSFKSATLTALGTVQDCNGDVEGCFSRLLYPGIPEYDFFRILIIAVLSALSIGLYFDFIPGRSYFVKTLLASLIMLLLMLFLGLVGIAADAQQELLMVTFELFAVALYGLIFALLYRRFTREVEFQSQKGSTKIIVDRRDLTGKKRTFGYNSSHKVEAVSDGRPFKGWLVSGGVSVAEPKQATTTIKIVGDGLLKAN